MTRDRSTTPLQWLGNRALNFVFECISFVIFLAVIMWIIAGALGTFMYVADLFMFPDRIFVPLWFPLTWLASMFALYMVWPYIDQPIGEWWGDL